MTSASAPQRDPLDAAIATVCSRIRATAAHRDLVSDLDRLRALLDVYAEEVRALLAESPWPLEEVRA